MKRVYCVTCFFALLTIMFMQGEQQTISQPPLECGWLLYLELREPYKIYIDTHYAGITPQLLTNLPAGEFQLRLEGEQQYHETRVICNPARSGLTVYRPVTENYKGKVSVNSHPPGAEILINGLNQGKTPLLLDQLGEGRYIFNISLPGYKALDQEVKVTRSNLTEIEVDLTRLYEVSFAPALDAGISVAFENETDSLLFKDGQPCLVPAGNWVLILRGKGMLREIREIVITDNLQIDFTPVHFDPKLVFTKLAPGSTVLVDGRDITAEITANSFLLPTGAYYLQVNQPGYLAFKSRVEVLEDRDTVVEIKYVTDPVIVQRKKKNAGWITLGAGAAVSALSLVLNWDELAIGISNGNYDTYTLLKYSTLGAFSVGAAGVAVGLWLQF